MAEILKSKGNEAFKGKDYAKADELYRNALILDPENAVLYSNRAMTLIKLEDWESCIEIVDAGLSKLPDSKTRVKLLWRKGTSLVKLNEFRRARESYNEALQIESNNQSVLKSIDDLDVKESQFKRSHSIDEFETDKRVKTVGSLERIPIYEVDELPVEFQEGRNNVKKPTPSTTVNDKPSFKDLKSSKLNKTLQSLKQNSPKTSQPSKASIIPSVSNTPKQSSQQLNQPTINSLSLISNSHLSPSPETLSSIFSASTEQYSAIFKGGNIDHKILNLILTSIIHALESSEETDSNNTKTEVASHANQLLKTFSGLPRFSLVQFFVDKTKLNKVKELLESKEVETWY